MKAQIRKKALQQLDETLARFTAFRDNPPPQRGWVRAVREALGMSRRQLGERMGVSTSRVWMLEKDEAAGKVTLNTLRRVAEVLDCQLMYALVPNSSLSDTAAKRARSVAMQRVGYVDKMMRLEEQGLSAEELWLQVDAITEELIKDPPRNLWDKLDDE